MSEPRTAAGPYSGWITTNAQPPHAEVICHASQGFHEVRAAPGYVLRPIEAEAAAVATALLRALVDGLTEGRFMDELAAARSYLDAQK